MVRWRCPRVAASPAPAVILCRAPPAHSLEEAATQLRIPNSEFRMFTTYSLFTKKPIHYPFPHSPVSAHCLPRHRRPPIRYHLSTIPSFSAIHFLPVSIHRPALFLFIFEIYTLNFEDVMASSTITLRIPEAEKREASRILRARGTTLTRRLRAFVREIIDEDEGRVVSHEEVMQRLGITREELDATPLVD